MTIQTQADVPEWVRVLIDWSQDTSPMGAELNFEGVAVPQPIQHLLARAFLPSLEDMEQEVFEVNVANGWWEDRRSVGDDVALLHTEVSEIFEAFREFGTADATGDKCETDSYGVHLHGEKPCKPEGIGSECADVLIRLLDTVRRWELDLRYETERKLAFNRTRGHKHGGKRI